MRQSRARYRRKLFGQKMCGFGLLVITGLIIALALTGQSAGERDGTAALITLPLGAYLIFTKHIVIV